MKFFKYVWILSAFTFGAFFLVNCSDKEMVKGSQAPKAKDPGEEGQNTKEKVEQALTTSVSIEKVSNTHRDYQKITILIPNAQGGYDKFYAESGDATTLDNMNDIAVEYKESSTKEAIETFSVKEQRPFLSLRERSNLDLMVLDYYVENHPALSAMGDIGQTGEMNIFRKANDGSLVMVVDDAALEALAKESNVDYESAKKLVEDYYLNQLELNSEDVSAEYAEVVAPAIKEKIAYDKEMEARGNTP